MMKSKNKIVKIAGNVIFLALILLLVLPSGRTWVQQRLMDFGLFKPELSVEDQQKVATDTAETEEANVGVAFSDDSGKLVKISDLKGKVVFVNFWATWCPPCKAEMPSIQSLKDKFKDNDQVVFLLVEIEGAQEKAQAFMKEGGMDLPVYYPASEIPEDWLAAAIPTTVILDKTGHMVTRHEGMADYASAEVFDFITSLTQK